MKQKVTWFDWFNTILIALLTFICFYPLWYVFVVSISTQAGYYNDIYHIIPNSFTLASYKAIVLDKFIFRAFGLSVEVTVIGTILSIIATAMAGYIFSKSHLPGMSFLYKAALFTMYFSGGIVPIYLLVKTLHLDNTIWALILPCLISTFNCILARNYFLSLPASLEESARIDGASEFTILAKIVVPLSKPILATLVLFYAVGYWNAYMGALLYMNESRMFTLPLVIRTLLTGAANADMQQAEAKSKTFTVGMNMASVFVSMIPILLIYPWLQKYFVKGIMVGAVKG